MPTTKKNAEEADEGGGEPSVLFALVEHNLQAAHGQGEEGQSHVVHVAQARRIGLDPRRIVNEAGDEDEGQDADGNVDEENPAPGEIVSDIAAERGADGGSEHGDQAVEREGLPALVGLKGISHDGLRHGLHAAAERALQYPAEEEDGQGGRRATKKAGDGEAGDAKDEEVAASHEGAGPSAEG